MKVSKIKHKSICCVHFLSCFHYICAVCVAVAAFLCAQWTQTTTNLQSCSWKLCESNRGRFFFCREIYPRFINLIDFFKCLTVVIKQYVHIALNPCFRSAPPSLFNHPNKRKISQTNLNIKNLPTRFSACTIHILGRLIPIFLFFQVLELDKYCLFTLCVQRNRNLNVSEMEDALIKDAKKTSNNLVVNDTQCGKLARPEKRSTREYLTFPQV